MKTIAMIDPDELLAACEDDLGNWGFCTACGEQQGGCEPDARRYECEACGAKAIYGAEELLVMGYAG